jgi:hypothetical protein
LQAENPKTPDIVRLVFLDGSPEFIKAQVNVTKSETMTLPQKESEGLVMFVLSLSSADYTKTVKKLTEMENLEKRLDYVADLLMASSKVFKNRDEVRQAAHQFYRRLHMSFDYKVQGKYQGSALLIRTNEYAKLNIGDDLGLKKLCSGDVTVHVTKGTHHTFMLGDSAKDLADLINKKMQA